MYRPVLRDLILLAAFRRRASVARRRRAARRGGPNSEDRMPRASATANRPFTSAPTRMSSGKLRWGLDCRHLSCGTTVFS